MPRHLSAFILAYSRKNIFWILKKLGVFDGSNVDDIIHYKLDSIMIKKTTDKFNYKANIGPEFGKFKIEMDEIKDIHIKNGNNYMVSNENITKTRGTFT